MTKQEFDVVIPNHRQACELFEITNEVQCCGNCWQYHSTPLASPCGWCNAFPSKVADTGDNMVCDCYEHRRPITGDRIEDSWEDIFASENDGSYLEKYHTGDVKQVEINGQLVDMEIVCISDDDDKQLRTAGHITWVPMTSVKIQKKDIHDPHDELHDMMRHTVQACCKKFIKDMICEHEV